MTFVCPKCGRHTLARDGDFPDPRFRCDCGHTVIKGPGPITLWDLVAEQLAKLDPAERAEILEASKAHQHGLHGPWLPGWTCPDCPKDGTPLGVVSEIDPEKGEITIAGGSDG